MGQQNEKVIIQKIDQQTQIRRTNKIFPQKYEVRSRNQRQKCDRPNCRCPGQHITRQNLKLCQSCNNPHAPTIRKNKKLAYEESTVRRSPQSKWEYQTVYKESPAIEKQEPVYYYNGWGLPTQKCYVDAIIPELPRPPVPPVVNPQVPPQPMPEPVIPQPSPQKPQIVPVIEPPRPIPINIEEVDIRNRMQNLFLFP